MPSRPAATSSGSCTTATERGSASPTTVQHINAQGDVTGITDSSCSTVVEYTYDAWGKLLSTTGSLAGTIGKVNPFLYRGYYYDSETGLYYLNSRCYDPQTGRFINADDTSVLQLDQNSLRVYNLYTYGNNNPIMNIDPTGYFHLSAFWSSIIIDSLLYLIPYVVSLFGSIKSFSYAARFSIYFRNLVKGLTPKLAKTIYSSINWITSKLVGM